MLTVARTKHCWQNYVDYHKCILAKGEDFKPCRQVLLKTQSAQEKEARQLTVHSVLLSVPVALS